MTYLAGICLLYRVVLTERLTIEGMAVGILIVSAVLLFNGKIYERNVHSKYNVFKYFEYLASYVLVLIKEIILSNIHVAKIVLSPKLNISPILVKVNTDIKSDLNKVIFANSITLTPGTLTILMEQDGLLIHCLEEKSAKGLKNPEIEKIIMKAEE